MSRSFKKNPYISDNSVEYKKIAHRTTRRRIKEMDDILPSKGHYNKLYQSYYIHDYSPRWISRSVHDQSRDQCMISQVISA